MQQNFSINLEALTATLDINESGKDARYVIDLEPDRSSCFVTRLVLEGEEAVESKTWISTLEELGNDGTMPPAVMWAARGMWGIPLEFSGAQELSKNDPIQVEAVTP